MTTTRRRATAKTEPRLLQTAPQKMAVVTTVGDPNVVGPDVFPALYGAVYTLKFALKKSGVDYKVPPPRARWPNAHIAPKDQWIGRWGLPVPEETVTLTQKVSGVEVKLEVWEYGTVAEIMHLGSFDTEEPTVERLHRFIEEAGYEIAGPHEEEYLTRPGAKAQKTLIRYAVRKKQ